MTKALLLLAALLVPLALPSAAATHKACGESDTEFLTFVDVWFNRRPCTGAVVDVPFLVCTDIIHGEGIVVAPCRAGVWLP